MSVLVGLEVALQFDEDNHETLSGSPRLGSFPTDVRVDSKVTHRLGIADIETLSTGRLGSEYSLYQGFWRCIS